ncbi:MAG: hypothetical protein ACSLFA_22390 [Mycobacterium sp.]
MHAGIDDEVIICGVFDNDEGDAHNAPENVHSHAGLTRSKFEGNYRRWVRRPPGKSLLNWGGPAQRRAARLQQCAWTHE